MSETSPLLRPRAERAGGFAEHSRFARRSAVVLLLGVLAAAAVAGCAAAQEPTAIRTPVPSVATEAPAPEPAATQESTPEGGTVVETQAPQAPQGRDELTTWTDGTVLPDYQWLADSTGLESIMKPKQVYVNAGVVGVAPVGLRCIVTFDQNADDPGNYSAYLMTRFDRDYLHDGNNLAPEEIKLMLENYAFVCSPSG